MPEGTNPARGIHKFEESRRERFLTREELNRLGIAIQEGETGGIPWTVDESPASEHVPKAKCFTKIARSAAAALRLLFFTGCRLREILHLRWEHLGFERGCLFLPDSKSGRKTVILNAPALAVFNAMEPLGPQTPEKARDTEFLRSCSTRDLAPSPMCAAWQPQEARGSGRERDHGRGQEDHRVHGLPRC